MLNDKTLRGMKTTTLTTLETFEKGLMIVELEMHYDEKYDSNVVFVNSRNRKRVGEITDVDRGIIVIDCKAYRETNYYEPNQRKDIPLSGYMECESDDLKLTLDMMSNRLFEAREEKANY